MIRSLPRAVVFDWDHTLVDSFGPVHAALAVTFRRFGRTPWTFEETQTRVRASLRDSFPGLFGVEWEAARDVFYAAFADGHLDGLSAMPGAGATLDHLSARGIPLAIVSNKTGPFLRTEVAHMGWGDRFRRVVGAQDAVRDKPDPAPVGMALDGLCQPGADVWFVGDSAIDMECAKRSGCRGILVGEGHGDAFDAAPPDLRLNDLFALRDIVPKE